MLPIVNSAVLCEQKKELNQFFPSFSFRSSGLRSIAPTCKLCCVRSEGEGGRETEREQERDRYGRKHVTDDRLSLSLSPSLSLSFPLSLIDIQRLRQSIENKTGRQTDMKCRTCLLHASYNRTCHKHPHQKQRQTETHTQTCRDLLLHHRFIVDTFTKRHQYSTKSLQFTTLRGVNVCCVGISKEKQRFTKYSTNQSPVH